TSGTRAVNVHLQTTTAGVFQAPVSLSVGTRRPLDVTLADLTGQGQLDVVVAASGGNDVLVFLHGATPGTFLAPLALPVSGDPAAVAVGDLTGTGTKDIAVAMANGKVAILRQGATPGTFQAAVEYVMGWDPVAIRIADINGDGRQDLLTANYTQGGGGLSVLLQSAMQPGHFLPEQTFDTGDDACAGLAVGDVNGDGLPDIVVANAGLPGWPGSVSVFLQDPRTIANGETQIHLKAPDLYRGYYGPLSVVIADLKGDGHPALVIADGSPSIRWPDPASPGHFQPPVWLKQ
ncbi:MAG: VCBS repeat-containing protein, partial [Firmicutes bacterium]|nr:VCBS repeat-containing protein [Bacillota bacterium]